MQTTELRSEEATLELLNHGEGIIRGVGNRLLDDMHGIYGSRVPAGIINGWWDPRSGPHLRLQDVGAPGFLKHPKMQARCRAEITRLMDCCEPSERNDQLGWAVNVRGWVFGCAGFPSTYLNVIFVLVLMHRLRIISELEAQVVMRMMHIELDTAYFTRLFG